MMKQQIKEPIDNNDRFSEFSGSNSDIACKYERSSKSLCDSSSQMFSYVSSILKEVPQEQIQAVLSSKLTDATNRVVGSNKFIIHVFDRSQFLKEVSKTCPNFSEKADPIQELAKAYEVRLKGIQVELQEAKSQLKSLSKEMLLIGRQIKKEIQLARQNGKNLSNILYQCTNFPSLIEEAGVPIRQVVEGYKTQISSARQYEVALRNRLVQIETQGTYLVSFFT